MADYMELLASHHDAPAGPAVQRGAFVHDLMRGHETALLQLLLDWASARNDLRLLGPADAELRAPTVALDLGRPAEPVAEALAEHGIMAGGGDFYAVRALEAMGIDPAKGVLRLSFTHYTTEEEVEKLIEALEAVLSA
jgi:selenocysteine lyase/cysteine desulfurase